MCAYKKEGLLAENQNVNESTRQLAGTLYQQLRLMMQVIHLSEYS
jgi:hypothetical protein